MSFTDLNPPSLSGNSPYMAIKCVHLHFRKLSSGQINVVLLPKTTLPIVRACSLVKGKNLLTYYSDIWYWAIYRSVYVLMYAYTQVDIVPVWWTASIWYYIGTCRSFLYLCFNQLQLEITRRIEPYWKICFTKLMATTSGLFFLFFYIYHIRIYSKIATIVI